ncbi:MAG: hypothetical protein E7D50_00865 [Finegoldia magna]|nr:hypothetical protein [Finegoldia magna]
MKNLKLESIEIKNNARWLNGKQHIESFNYIDKDINTDEEKIIAAIECFHCYLLSLPVWNMLNEECDGELDHDEDFIAEMLFEMCYHRNRENDLELKEEIGRCILKLYENETIVQINNVLLYLEDDYDAEDYDSTFINSNEKYGILKEIYILDMYLSHDIKDLYLYNFNYEQILEIYEGFKNRVDARIYAKGTYDWRQMKEIREELEDWNIDISNAKIELDEEEMSEIREKLEEEKRKSTH